MATPPTETPRLRVVAFGASAGGLQALRPIINGLERDGGTAYLIAHHLSPVHPTSLAELLGAQSKLAVVAAAQDEALLADRVYVCPPGYDIELAGGRLTLLPADPAKSIAPSIDRLFRSLAEQLREKAVAVILSGSGSDGTLGAGAINGVDGTVIVQLPTEAVQPGMPQAAINAGFADLIGNSDEIVDWLNDLEHLAEALVPAAADATAGAFADIFQQVVDATGLDLGQYKDNTLRRQTVRRYRSLGMNSLEQYLKHLRAHPEEVYPLQQSFMISVSSFFRDAAAFDALEKSLRKLIAGKRPGDSVRVWVPACATGEEPYSIAILIAEILGERLRRIEVRIFATDIDQRALDFARAGVYSTAALARLDPARRQRWFTPDGSGWRIGKAIRELCVFSHHDVIANPPFIKMDLVSCRNLLIYFKSEQQADLINTFHYGLNLDGLLMLGKSEAAGFNSRLFETIDGVHKLYRRRSGAAMHPARPSRFGMPNPLNRSLLPTSTVTPQRQTLIDATLHTIARQYAPPGVLVNASFEPLHFFGQSQRYFSLPGDHVDFSVFSLCLPTLRSELKALCYRLIQENLEHLQGVGVDLQIDGQDLRIRPVLRRITQPAVNDDFAFLISFDEIPLAARPPKRSIAEPDDRRAEEIVRLRQELADSREQLQAVIEELEASNEELQSLNEEVQSSSEELQSSNEELQSSNEELTTLNDELRMKSLEAAQLTTTLGNIQNSIRTSLVVLDHDGRITRYNALATRIFGLVSNDLGQFLYGIPCHLHLPNLRQQVGEVMASGDSLVEQVRQGDFHYLMQIDPYRDEAGENAGAVLTFSDISDLHRAELAQQSSEIRFRHVWEASLEGLLVADSQGRIVLVNPALEAMFGYGAGELSGQMVEALVPEAVRRHHVEERQAFQNKAEQVRGMGVLRNLRGCRRDGSEFFVEISLSGMVVSGERYVLASTEDVTERKLAEDALRKSEQRLRLAQDAARSGTWEWDLESNENFWSNEIWNLYGLKSQQVAPSFEAWRGSIHARDRDRVVATITDAVARAAEFEADWQVNLPESAVPRFVLSRGRPILGPEGRPCQYIGIVLDITERKHAEAELEAYRNNLEILVRQRTVELSDLYNRAPCGYHSLDADGVFINVNDTELGWLGYTRAELLGRKRAIDIMAPDCRATFSANFPKLIESGELSGLEFDFTRKDGTLLPILLNARAVYDDDGKFLYSLSTIIDNTARKRAESAWIAAREAAENASLAKSTFLANMSHEIRTPMNAIIGFTHLLRRTVKESEQADKLGKIAAAADHLLGVIDDILDISKIEADKLVLENSNFEVEDVLSRVAAMVIERVREKGLELVIDAETIPGTVCGDATRLGQALLNYLGNAVKFTERGTIILRARLIEENDDNVLIRFEAEDTGIGIDPEHLPRLFHAFEQADASTTRRFGGTGLGLTITRRIARLMGGETGVSSIPGVGSTFWMTARLGRVAEQAGAYRIPQLQGKRALVIDDTPVTRHVQSQLLRMAGLESAAVASGKEALQAVAAADAAGRPFDLILIDLLMPEMDGFETKAKLEALPLRHAPMHWLVTASGNPDRLEDARRCGFAEVLQKPLSAALLHEALSRQLASLSGHAGELTPDTLAPAASDVEAALRRDYADARLLVVDDDPINLELALLVLGDIGWRVDVAANGQEAVERASCTAYDLILMDMQMPVMSGIEATGLIRQLPERRAMPILAMTANAFNEDRETCLAAGMDDFITKPVEPDKLFASLHKWLRSGRSPQQPLP